MVKAKWLASLSDGAMAIEGTPPFDVIPGELSPWLRLQEHLTASGLHITGLRIQVEKPGESIKTYNLPSYRADTLSGKHERWQFIQPMQPLSYNYGRVAEASWGGGRAGAIRGRVPHIFICAEYETFTVYLFVDQIEGAESWVVVRENTTRPS